ncbi:MAG: aminotransferase class V-fold PLP-dependent enzyme [Flavobacteriaceae bacterium]|nr:aminotransferase class V-fold PLP-dependent enzyme [Bacteroidia bacterium]MBT8287301.1 aminotransferase class V-fold PLP-dependent enzyme [Bacteroidia bacterium]NNF74218.1 aminotransferase class V-fold PLP-dependent enzyme [Flavobacteriaceae bacterium]NNK71728.1 aminotransferase class V-fold PLP-dependent enzyme [Flavobacteriaceae bacterium]
MTLDLNFIRSQFPAFSEPSLDGWAFFENAGGSYPCKPFIDKLTSFYMKNKVQPYYPYPASIKAGKMMDESYKRMAAYLNVDESEIHFGPSTTQNVYVLANAMRPMWKDGDEIIVSCQDHEANAGAWRRLSSRGIIVREWHVDKKSGVLDLEELKTLLTDRTKMIAFPHCSNVIGHINPAKDISVMAHKHGALSVIDGVGYAPHGFPDLKELGADIYMFSLYKTFGPHLGLMYVDKTLIGKLQNQSHFFKEGISRSMITPAGPDHAQIASVSGILDYFDAVYKHHFEMDAEPAKRNNALRKLFRAHETGLLEQLLDFLRSRDDVEIVGPDQPANRLPIVSIIPKNKPLMQVYNMLIEHKLMPGYGDFYAVRPLMDMDIQLDPGVLRMSFVHYTTKAEVDQLIDGLKRALRQ